MPELARITQEALVNVRKPSGAHNVVVRFISEAGCPKLMIDNDGRGPPLHDALDTGLFLTPHLITA